jgi:hypothetical protein
MLDSACVRIGELARELETAPTRTPAAEIRSGQPDIIGKVETLAQAGIPRTTANDYEHLAGGREQQAQDAARAGAESYFAASRQAEIPATLTGLKAAMASPWQVTDRVISFAPSLRIYVPGIGEETAPYVAVTKSKS